MSGKEIFIGAKVLIGSDPDDHRLGFVFSHDGAYAGGNPWRVAIMDDCGVYFDYHYYDRVDLAVLGDFGECHDDDHPLRVFWERYYQDCYDWASFVRVYNNTHGSKHDSLEGEDAMDMVEDI